MHKIGKMAALLKKELEKAGVLLFAGVDGGAFPKRGKKPFNLSPPVFAQKLANKNILVCSWTEVIELTPDLDIIWQFGEYGVLGNDEAHLNSAYHALCYEDKVIIADGNNGRVIEVDKSTKRITRQITGLGSPMGWFINPDTGGLLIAETSNHYISERDWEGRVIWDFGVKCESGSDANHLKSPMCAQPAKSTFAHQKGFDAILISDTGNNRVILVDRANKLIRKEVVICSPEKAFQTPDAGISVANYVLGFVADQDWHIRWYPPFKGNWMPIPTEDGTYLLCDAAQLFEVEPKLFKPYRLPGAYRMLTNYLLKG